MKIHTIIYTLVAFAITAGFIPLIILLCKKNQWYDRINSRKIHSGKIPRLGGVGFTLIFLIVAVVYLVTSGLDSFIRVIPVLLSAIIVFIMGVVDDFRELRARLKLPGQCIASLLPVIFGFQFNQFGPLPLGILGKVITFWWFLGLINALNLIDGIDALCGSISCMMLVSLGILLHVQGVLEASTLAFILAGCVAAFLLYNKPKAAIFMGDGGSQFLGFMIAALPLLGKTPRLEYNLLPLMIVLAAIPILDTFAAIWRRTRERRSFFSPDKLHLHHKLLGMGHTKKSILFFLSVIQFGICAVSLFAMLWIEGLRGFFVLAGAFMAMIVFFAIIHYTSRSVLRLNEQKGQKSN